MFKKCMVILLALDEEIKVRQNGLVLILNIFFRRGVGQQFLQSLPNLFVEG